MEEARPSLEDSSPDSPLLRMGRQRQPKGESKGGRRPRKKFIRRVKCRVCGDVANDHVHYGGVSCYSCRAFFRRSVTGGEGKRCVAMPAIC